MTDQDKEPKSEDKERIEKAEILEVSTGANPIFLYNSELNSLFNICEFKPYMMHLEKEIIQPIIRESYDKGKIEGFNEGIEALEKSLIARGFNKEDYNGVIIFEEIEKLKTHSK